MLPVADEIQMVRHCIPQFCTIEKFNFQLDRWYKRDKNALFHFISSRWAQMILAFILAKTTNFPLFVSTGKLECGHRWELKKWQYCPHTSQRYTLLHWPIKPRITVSCYKKYGQPPHQHPELWISWNSREKGPLSDGSVIEMKMKESFNKPEAVTVFCYIKWSNTTWSTFKHDDD